MVTPDPELKISPDKICHIVVKAREFDAQDVETNPASSFNATDNRMVSVLEKHANDPTRAELVAFIDGLSENEQIELVALFWLGRGDGSLDDWAALNRQARGAHSGRTAAYLLGQSLLADHLEEGLSNFGRSCEDFEMGGL